MIHRFPSNFQAGTDKLTVLIFFYLLLAQTRNTQFSSVKRAERGLSQGKKAWKYFNKCCLSEARSMHAKSSNLHVLLKVKKLLQFFLKNCSVVQVDSDWCYCRYLSWQPDTKPHSVIFSCFYLEYFELKRHKTILI